MRQFGLFLFLAAALFAQAPPHHTTIQPVDTAQDIPANRGAAALWQLLQKLHTRASLVMVTAHPDDEDGGMLTYESRKAGARATLLTLNRGEGGANVMSPDFFDGLGLVRTMELLEAGRHYGVDQYWTRVVDYGFSKDKEEALEKWTKNRVLADAVRVVRMTRPLVVTSVFVGSFSDGHGNHQVAGQMAKEIFQAAGDSNVFPEQIRAGLRPWAPLKYYARVPFARRGGSNVVKTDLEVPVGDYDPLLGMSYVQLARQGLGYQKSQTGGPAIPLAGRQTAAYHRFESRVPVPDQEKSFFDGIDVSLGGIAALAKDEDATFLAAHLTAINHLVEESIQKFDARSPEKIAPLLAKGYQETDRTLAAVASSKLSDAAKFDIIHELQLKKVQFNHALAVSLGLSVSANVTTPDFDPNSPMAMFRGQPDTFRMAIPGQKFPVTLHVANQSGLPVAITKTTLETPTGESWQVTEKGAIGSDFKFEVQVADNARFTRPYFTRPNIEQTYYDLTDERYLGLSLAPYPVAAWAEFNFEGVPIRIGQIVQTTQRVTGQGIVYEPLAVAPAISVSLRPHYGIVPLSAKSFPVTALIHSNVKGEATGTVRLELPQGWKSSPASAQFSTPNDGADQSIEFIVTPIQIKKKAYECTAVAEYNEKQYREGYQLTGYTGSRPYFLYQTASLKTSGVDVNVAPNLKIGYITGTGDEVPESLGNLGLKVTFLSTSDLATGDLSKNDVIIVGVRAYAAREDLKTHNGRLLDYVKNGGVVIVQYNTPEFDHNYGPYPYVMGNNPEEVTDEESKIEILDPANPIFNWPNKITSADFTGWVEERGSKFLQTWDPQYTALLSTNDAGQAPQKGGLLFARYGKGIYVYNAYAFYRQLPEGVPGAYRLFANMISLARRP